MSTQWEEVPPYTFKSFKYFRIKNIKFGRMSEETFDDLAIRIGKQILDCKTTVSQWITGKNDSDPLEFELDGETYSITKARVFEKELFLQIFGEKKPAPPPPIPHEK